MPPRRSLGLTGALALGLAVPATLAGAALVIRRGAAGLRTDQRRAAEAAAAEAVLDVAEALASLGRMPVRPEDDAPPIELDDAGRPSGPFVPLRELAADASGALAAPLSIAAAEAMRLEAQRRAHEALPWFEAVASSDGARPLVALAHARALLAAGAPARAVERLRSVPDTSACERVGGLPFALLAELLASRAAQADDGDHTAAARERILDGTWRLPAGAVRAVSDWLAARRGAQAALPAPFLLAADLFADLDAGRLAPPRAATRWREHVVLPAADGLRLLDGARVRALAEERLRAANATAAQVDLVLHDAPTPDAEASAPLPGTPWVVAATAREARAAARLGLAADVLLVLAGITLVGGNLLVHVLARRTAAVSRLKSDFIDLVSHELRTPLSALLLKAEMLSHGEVPAAKVVQYQTDLHREAGKLGVLVEQILDFARLEKGKTPVEPRPVPARALLAAGVRAARPTLRAAQLALRAAAPAARRRLRIAAPRDLPLVDADAPVLARALRNLLENAARYATGDVDVSASQSNGCVRLAIADRGPGVALHERARIFEPFQRGRAAQGRPGSGLGLAIVAQAVAAHGGRVTVAARGGGGAVFTIELPARSGDRS